MSSMAIPRTGGALRSQTQILSLHRWLMDWREALSEQLLVRPTGPSVGARRAAMEFCTRTFGLLCGTVQMGVHFCNLLWHACPFATQHLPSSSHDDLQVKPERLPLGIFSVELNLLRNR